LIVRQYKLWPMSAWRGRPLRYLKHPPRTLAESAIEQGSDAIFISKRRANRSIGTRASKSKIWTFRGWSGTIALPRASVTLDGDSS